MLLFLFVLFSTILGPAPVETAPLGRAQVCRDCSTPYTVKNPPQVPFSPWPGRP